MSVFERRDGELFVEDVPLARVAEQYGTPTYVYSRAAFTRHYLAYAEALGEHPGMVCYAVKANSNLAVLDLLARLGAGFDIVSGGELERVLRAGGDPARVVFSGVGKTREEMARALDVGIFCFNVESEAELEQLSEVAAEQGRTARISLRVNPDVDAQTHPYISTGLKENKFGIDIALAPAVYQRATQLPGLDIVGVDCHIGSQITEVSPYLDALGKLIDLIKALADQGIALKHLDLGGGIGIRYTDETPLTPSDLLSRVFQALDSNNLGHLQIVLEPGRSLVGNAGVLLTRVEYLKHNDTKNFAIVDAAMNDLLRPTLYDAWHGVETVRQRETSGPICRYDVVGPICESGDWLARDRELRIEPGDLLAIMSAGAYAFSMASQYNSRPRPAEIMVDGTTAHVVRQRETVESLFANEQTIPVRPA